MIGIRLIREKGSNSEWKVENLSECVSETDKKKKTKKCNLTKNTDGDVFKFNDIVVFRIEKQSLNKIYYKTAYGEDQFKIVNVKEKERRTKKALISFNEVRLNKAYNESLPIAKKKHDDLMYLLNNGTIKKCHSYFYNSLRVSTCMNEP
ncbi:hypothetical protein ABEB36_000355 [Hypothenemus hampei]|uniref:Uncharacterized protein n=1 Tax=Hypothenemus hampei TaxID=57062 RepID=A0ABD1FBG9_HYPHA